MKWDILLLIVSVSMLLFWAGSGYIEHWMAAEYIAEELAPRIGANEDLLRSNLRDILECYRLGRVVVYCSPWAILSLILTVKILTDVVKKQRDISKHNSRN
jgi:hypothetical protein